MLANFMFKCEHLGHFATIVRLHSHPVNSECREFAGFILCPQFSCSLLSMTLLYWAYTSLPKALLGENTFQLCGYEKEVQECRIPQLTLPLSSVSAPLATHPQGKLKFKENNEKLVSHGVMGFQSSESVPT